MTRKTRNLLITLILLAVIIGAVLVMRLPGESTEESNTPVMRAPEILSDNDPEELRSIKTETAAGILVFSSPDGRNWRLDDTAEFYRLNGTTAGNALNTFARLRSSNIVAENADSEKEAEYGLDNPAAVVTIEDFKGNATVLEIGDLNPSGSGRYARVADSTTIVIIPAVVADYAFRTEADYRDMSLPVVSMEDLAFLEFRREDLVFRMEPRIAEDPFVTLVSPFVISSPWLGEYPLDDHAFQAAVTDEAPIPIRVRKYLDAADAEDPSLGLDEETADRLYLSDSKGGVLNLFLGNEVGNEDGSDSRYAKLGDRRDTVFTLSDADVAFIDIEPFQLLSKFVFLGSISQVSQVKVEKGREIWIMDRTERGNPDDTKDDRFLVNNLEVAHKEFTSVYQKFIGLMWEGIAVKDVDLISPEVRMTVNSVHPGVEPMIIRYWPYDEVYFQVSIGDGPLEFLVGRYQVEDFLEDLAALSEYGS